MNTYSKTTAIRDGIYGVPLYPQVKIASITEHHVGGKMTYLSVATMFPITRGSKEYAIKASKTFQTLGVGTSLEDIQKFLGAFESFLKEIKEKYSITGLVDPVTGTHIEIELY